MRTAEEIIEQAKQLPIEERRRVLDALKATVLQDRSAEPPPVEGPYARSLALAGTMHSNFDDVSADKYKHLAAAYGDDHELP